MELELEPQLADPRIRVLNHDAILSLMQGNKSYYVSLSCEGEVDADKHFQSL